MRVLFLELLIGFEGLILLFSASHRWSFGRNYYLMFEGHDSDLARIVLSLIMMQTLFTNQIWRRFSSLLAFALASLITFYPQDLNCAIGLLLNLVVLIEGVELYVAWEIEEAHHYALMMRNQMSGNSGWEPDSDLKKIVTQVTAPSLEGTGLSLKGTTHTMKKTDRSSQRKPKLSLKSKVTKKP